ncbi:glutathione S-transferase [Photobacterium sp. NCIMB 13483]|uniref:Glutathione S-transferase n=1 Tax=Photobacterium piscicola TaxID=1378299 RepID=A0ABU6LLR2_9GAMM|nr:MULTISPECIES: glutathione S-transferase [Photobacterium]MEC6881549.1 glutathione S-transferase [Photobacterium piscicola]MEC6898895.1 glutathione S-transferase [Photobacterium piscicola]PST89064.1 glutathione S-transferase [Photobacterium sp. NCIMB 13483]
MITLHHLNKSRSKRIIWLLEELDLAYEVKPYLRDAVTFLAPPELKNIHPLGKSPVIEDNGAVIAESGAITEYLIQTYNPNLAPKVGTPAYIEYLQWLHFAESSAILPLLLKMFVAKDGAKTNFLEGYADVEAEKVISYFEQSLEGKTYLVEERLTGADIMMSFIAEILQNNGMIVNYPNIQRYQAQLATHDKFIKADQIEQQLG